MSEFLAEDVVDGQRVITTKNIEGTVQQNNAYSTEVLVEVSDGVYQRCIAVKDLGGGSGGASSFADLSGSPYDNENLSEALNDKQDELVSGTNIKTINNESILGSGNLSIDGLPDQTGNAGKMIATNGETASWVDKDYYRSLSTAQATTLEEEGTYNGEEVEDGEVFTSVDGKFLEFDKEHHQPGESYVNTNTTISPVNQSSALATAYNNTEMVVRAPSSDGYVEYSEDGGVTWQRSSLLVSETPYDFSVGTGINLSMCKGATSADVFIVRTGAHDYVTTSYHSTDGGKTFVEKGNQNGDSRGIFLGYLKTAGKLFYVKDHSLYNPYYSTDNGATWTKIDSFGPTPSYGKNFGQLDDDTIIVVNGADVYTTQDLETFTQISSSGPSADSSGTWFNRIRRCGDYLVCRGWNNGDKLCYSDDEGVHWNWTSIDTTHGACLDYDNGTYISFDASGYFYTSSDLLSGWEQSSFFSFSSSYNSTNAQPVVHAQNKFVFSSASGSAVVPSAAYDTYSLTQLSYDKDEVDALISGGSSLTEIAEAGTGIKFDGAIPTQNFTLVGSPTITDGVLSNVSSSNYLKADYTFNVGSSDWELDGSVTTTNTGSYQYFLGNTNEDLKTILLGIEAGELHALFSSDGSNWGDTTGTGSWVTVSANTKYYFKYIYDGDGTYSFSVSTDKTNWTTHTWTGSAISSTSPIYIGSSWDRNISPLQGSVDLNDYAIIKDGETVWAPYTVSSKPAITLDIATDQANAPTSSDEGYVGKLYVTDGGAVYICTGVSGSTYTWAQITTS